jgi:hypothetical protein
MATQLDMQRAPDDPQDAGHQRGEHDLPMLGDQNDGGSDVPGTNPDEEVPGQDTPPEPSPGDAPPDDPATQNWP